MESNWRKSDCFPLGEKLIWQNLGVFLPYNCLKNKVSQSYTKRKRIKPMEWVCAILAITLVACTTLIATTTIADRYRDSVHDQLSRLMLIWMPTNITGMITFMDIVGCVANNVEVGIGYVFEVVLYDITFWVVVFLVIAVFHSLLKVVPTISRGINAVIDKVLSVKDILLAKAKRNIAEEMH